MARASPGTELGRHGPKRRPGVRFCYPDAARLGAGGRGGRVRHIQNTGA